VTGQAHHPPLVPGLGYPQADQGVRGTVGLLPSAGTPLSSSVMTTRPIAPRLPVAVSGHEHHTTGQAATGVQRKRPDRPPYLASLEQALIEKLHGPRKPVAAMIPGHSPAAQALPGTAMAWFPVAYGGHTQHGIHTPTAGQSPVVSPSFNTDLQLPASAVDMTVPVTLPATSLTGTFTYSGRTTPSVATTAEYVAGKSVAAGTAHNVTNESHEVSAVVDVDSAGQMASRHKPQFTVLAVNDDASHLHESTAVSEALPVSNDSLSQDTSAATQTCAPAMLASKAPVKKGRFRISDVKEGVDVTASNSQLDTSTQPHGAALMGSGARNDLSGSCEMTSALMTPELAVQQQVRSRMISALALGVLVCMVAYKYLHTN